LIVAGVGGSATPDTVVLRAAPVANRRQVGRRLVCAVDPTGALLAGGYAPPDDFFLCLATAGPSSLDEVKAVVGPEFPDLSAEVSVHADDPIAMLLEQHREPVLLAAGAVDTSRTQQMFGATTANTVAANARCLIVVARSR
jgi:nucleotide-binding universal stress UspA family protein